MLAYFIRIKYILGLCKEPCQRFYVSCLFIKILKCTYLKYKPLSKYKYNKHKDYEKIFYYCDMYF